MHPLVSIIVLNYRSPRDTVRCVQALLKQTIADALEIIVVDNHSDDESIGFIRAQLGSMPKVRIIEQRENIGYGRGNNAALPFAHGEYLLILNPDNVIPPDGVERMTGYLSAHPETGVVGPALVYADGTIRPSARPFPRPLDLLRKRLFALRWHREYETYRHRFAGKDAVEVDWMVGACLLLKTSLFRSLKGYDERFFLFFEDIDLCRRIKAQGKKVMYLPSIRVQDRKGRLSGDNVLAIFTKKTTRIHMVSAVKYFWKWGCSNRRAASA